MSPIVLVHQREVLLSDQFFFGFAKHFAVGRADIEQMTIAIGLKNALSKQNIRIDVPSTFTVGISTDPAVMTNAA